MCGGPPRLRQPAKTDDARSTEVIRVAFQQAKQPMIFTATLYTHLEIAGHLAVHRLPFSTACEGRWWSRGHSIQDGVEFSRDLHRQPAEEVDRRHGPAIVVICMALEEVDPPRLRGLWDLGAQLSSVFLMGGTLDDVV